MDSTDNVLIGWEAGPSSGQHNVVLGWEAGVWQDRWAGSEQLVSQAPDTDADASQDGFWTCAYCGQSNAVAREGCRGCQAPRRA